MHLKHLIECKYVNCKLFQQTNAPSYSQVFTEHVYWPLAIELTYCGTVVNLGGLMCVMV